MMRLRRFPLLAGLLLVAASPIFPERLIRSGSAEIRESLDRLQVLGSVMMIAAHPDDENNALLTYLGRGRKVETMYLALTRGEGGQNLIGSEQGDALGVIRTEELLGAAKIQGNTQWFTRAVDFGFSKTPQETTSKWNHELILRDAVFLIRKLRPDVIILRFSGTQRDGHGQHQASHYVGREAYLAAGDPTKFPDQLQWVKPWQAKRLMYNVIAFGPQMEKEADAMTDVVKIDVGAFDPQLGFSYAELAGVARSAHKTQSFGSAERRGSVRAHLQTLAGDKTTGDLFDGVDITWNRIPNGGAAVGALLVKASQSFTPSDPTAIVPTLVEARTKLAAIKDQPWATLKLAELDETIARCAALFVDFQSEREFVTPGSTVKTTLSIINRSKLPIQMAGMAGNKDLPYNQAVNELAEWKIPADALVSQPYWLREAKQRAGAIYTISDPSLLGEAENKPVSTRTVTFSLNGQEFSITRPLTHRFVDRVDGERVHAVKIVPAVAVRLSEPVLLFPNTSARKVAVEVKSNLAKAAGTLKLRLPSGWTATPAEHAFTLNALGEQAGYTFTVTPPTADSTGLLTAVATIDGREITVGMETIKYPHIEPQTLFPRAEAHLIRSPVKVSARKVGYITGAGDEVPAALAQLGLEVTTLEPASLATTDLSQFDAIVTGVRAYNSRPELRSNQNRLLEYVQSGGTMIVQYNTADGNFFGGGSRNELNRVGPYPIKIGRDRVTVEDAPVNFPAVDHPLLQSPNQIKPSDFEGWVQERGLYFASEWDAQYQPLFATHDLGEKDLTGGTLVTRYGKGTYIYTAFAWFRQLPAGVPGAYRIFANFLSASKTTGAK